MAVGKLEMNFLMRRTRKRDSVSCGNPTVAVTATRSVSNKLLD